MSCNHTVPEDIFICQQCGECCQGFGGTYVSDADIQAIADFIHTDTDTFVQRYCQPSGSRYVLGQADTGYCIFCDNKRCTIHPVKPRMCKAWPFIPNVLKDPENWRIMAGSCPGIRTDVPIADVLDCIRHEINKRTAEN